MTEIHTMKFDPSNMSAFGTLETAEMTPVFQGDFVYGLNSQLWNTSGSSSGASVDTNLSRLRVQSGTAGSAVAYIQNKKPVRYRAGQGTTARFTPLFTSGSANSTQLMGMGTISSGSPYDGYFFGYSGSTVGSFHYIRGTQYFTPQSSWNGDKVDGSAGTSFTWNPSFGSPVMIKYPYLGFGDIEFFIQIPTTGRWTLVHVIRYANTVNTTQLENPTLQFTAFVQNSGNTANSIMYCASVGIFISGLRNFVGNPRWAVDNNKATITTETCIINLKNCTTYNGVANRGSIRLNSISASNSANTTVFIRLKIGATIGGSPSYSPVAGSTGDSGTTITAGSSIASYDTAGTTVSGGTYIYNLSLGPSGSEAIDLSSYEFYLAPGEILSATGFALANATIGISLNFSEDI